MIAAFDMVKRIMLKVNSRSLISSIIKILRILPFLLIRFLSGLINGLFSILILLNYLFLFDSLIYILTHLKNFLLFLGEKSLDYQFPEINIRNITGKVKEYFLKIL